MAWMTVLCFCFEKERHSEGVKENSGQDCSIVVLLPWRFALQLSSQYSSDLPEFRLEAVKCVAPDFDFSDYLDMYGMCIVENADVAGLVWVWYFRYFHFVFKCQN
jgi:hypothetical protein